MNNTNATPIRVPIDDKATRRLAATTVGNAYIGTAMWWVCVVVFTGLSGLFVRLAWQAHRDEFGASWSLPLVAGALLCLAFGIAYVPLALAVTIYRARDLYYLDTGLARAAIATKPDKRRGALAGDVQGHSFGAWPRGQGAGEVLGLWVRDQVHADGGRLTGTALPGAARAYLKRGMVDDGRTVFVLIRVVSKSRISS